MKKIILILILFVPFVSFGQTDTVKTGKQEQYCLITATPKIFSKKVTIEVDFGQPAGLFSDQRLKDESGKVKSFNSSIDALNYMSSQGWLLVNAYVVTNLNVTGNITQTENVFHYMMRRIVR